VSAALGLKVSIARAVGAISRVRGGGTSVPGKVLVGLQKDAIGVLGSRLTRGSVLVSATNGKTTTARMAARIFDEAGLSLVHNDAGANMGGGVATALLQAVERGGALKGELGLFEVDELWLDRVAAQLHPRAIVLGNLFRDQLDRYGELETIAERWSGELHAQRLVLNADDPLVADIGREHPGCLYFGVQDDSLALAGLAHAADARHCRRCGAAYEFEAIYLGHLGRYRCPGCGQERPEPLVTASEVELEGVRSARFTLTTPTGEAHISLQLPGLYNVYNALAAAALATALDVPLARIAAGLHAVRAAFGRGEHVTLTTADGHARAMRILLVKNPAGANEVLRTLALEPGEHDLLGVLNDDIADGRDVSWIWDADFEQLAPRVRRVTCAGTRAADLAVRLKYAGVQESSIGVQPDLAAALAQAAGDRAEADGEAPLYALPTYTALLQLRKLLVARGEARTTWS
jgi:lipid II isoglutaminyl synthase (glutamine-hydrolysing)